MSWSSLDLCLPYMHIEDIATILSLPNRISNPIVKRDLLQKFLVQLPWNPRYQLHFRGPFLHHSDFQGGHKWWWLLSRPRGEDAASQPREVRRFPKQATWQNDQWPSKYVHWFNADSLPHDCLAPQSPPSNCFESPRGCWRWHRLASLSAPTAAWRKKLKATWYNWPITQSTWCELSRFSGGLFGWNSCSKPNKKLNQIVHVRYPHPFEVKTLFHRSNSGDRVTISHLKNLLHLSKMQD